AATMGGQQVTASGPLNATLCARAVLDTSKMSPERASELRTIPAERLLEAINARDPVLPFGSVSFAPVLDERSLTRHPFYPDAPPQSAHIPMIIGNTHDETRAFLRGHATNFSLTSEQVAERLAPKLRVGTQPEVLVSEYR